MDMLWHKAAGPIRNLRNRIELLNEKTFIVFALLVYILLAGANIFTHEMWRDEMHVWLTAKGSAGLVGLFQNMKCQGHPPLWYIMLYALSRLTRNPEWMQVLHYAIAVTSAGVFLKFAPFSCLQRLFFLLGYFPIYEYAAISRNYGIGILLMFCFCAACGNISRNFWILSIILILMGLSNPYAFIIAICLFLTLAFKSAGGADIRAAWSRHKPAVLVCITAVLLGLAISGVIMFPKSDCQYAEGWQTSYSGLRIGKTVSTVWHGLVPIPEFKHRYWNSNILEKDDMPLLSLLPFPESWGSTVIALREPQNILSVVLLLFLLLSLMKNRAAFIFFSLAVAGMLAFQYVVYAGFLRHFGHFFIVVIISIWLERIWNSGSVGRGILTRLSEALTRPRQALIIALLVVHFGVGIFASVMEWRYPFSEGKQVARFIKESGLNGLPIAGYIDYVASTAGGYLDRQIYYPNSDSFGTFVLFDGSRRQTLGTDEVLTKARQLAENKKSDVILMLNYDIGEENGTIPLAQFTDNLQHDESFYLYLLKYQGQ